LSKRVSKEETNLIHVSNLRKEFNGFTAVNGVSFEACPGEIFGLLGPNGAGKTTTLRMITTVLKPTAGEIRVNGYSVRHEPERVRAQLGVLAEATGLYDRLTAEENVRYFARLRDMPEQAIDSRVATMFPLLGIDEYAQKRAGALSRGMKQKVSLAIAMLHDPPVLIFDEPTSGLDVISARQVRDFIERYRRTDKTIIFSTHLMPEAERLCDRIAIINQGRVAAIGTFPELQRQSGEEALEEIFVKLVEEAGDT
jgi:sodium transport system ATP-binding protein